LLFTDPMTEHNQIILYCAYVLDESIILAVQAFFI